MKKIALLLTLVLSMHIVIPVKASDYTNILEKNKTLNTQKKELSKESEKLGKELDILKIELEETQKQLETKKEEIKKVEIELQKAIEEEQKQEAAMELRIKFMYENDMNFIEVLFDADSMGDFLANTEYIKSISKYDRQMLIELEKAREKQESYEKKLKKEEEELTKITEKLYKSQEHIREVIDKIKQNLSEIDKKIEENIKELNKYMDESGTPGPWLIEGLGYLSNPCPGARISSEFGPRIAPVPGASTYHQGRDYAAPSGTDIISAAEGVVKTVAYHSIRGNYIVIQHPNGLSTWYQHCTNTYVRVGDKIERGEKIATVGATGRVSGPHLHFIVEEENGKLVDPRKYL